MSTNTPKPPADEFDEYASKIEFVCRIKEFPNATRNPDQEFTAGARWQHAQDRQAREDAERDYKDMRYFQAEYIKADQAKRELEREVEDFKEQIDRVVGKLNAAMEQIAELEAKLKVSEETAINFSQLCLLSEAKLKETAKILNRDKTVKMALDAKLQQKIEDEKTRADKYLHEAEHSFDMIMKLKKQLNLEQERSSQFISKLKEYEQYAETKIRENREVIGMLEKGIFDLRKQLISERTRVKDLLEMAGKIFSKENICSDKHIRNPDIWFSHQAYDGFNKLRLAIAKHQSTESDGDS